jgi:hypothetical protein
MSLNAGAARQGRAALIAAILSVSALYVAAAGWIVGAMIVAFPELTFSLKLQDVLRDFITSKDRPITLFILLLADIYISIGILQHNGIREGLFGPKRAGWTLGSLLVYVLVALFGPRIGVGLLREHPSAIGMFALLLFAVPRALSYAPPERARTVFPAD